MENRAIDLLDDMEEVSLDELGGIDLDALDQIDLEDLDLEDLGDIDLDALDEIDLRDLGEDTEDLSDEELEALENLSDEELEALEEQATADTDGTLVDENELMGFETDYLHNNGFISETGDIIVMDDSEKGENFKLVYVDIESIAIVPRIRQNKNVEDLVRSIKSTGLLRPIIVSPTQTDGIYVLIDGYRRILACAKSGIRKVPCIVNIKVNTPEIPILEAMYNHSKDYNIREIVDYIDYLERQKGIMSASMIEYLIQLNSGDYTKLKDLLNDDDEDIISKLFNGEFTIEQAFKALEKRRKKESAEEKDNKQAERVYSDEEESGAENIAGSGEEADEVELTDEEIESLAVNATDIDDGLEDVSLDEMVEEGRNTPGYESHKQKVGEREYIDPAIRKAVMARDNFTCACCKKGGESYVDALDYHHILPVYLGGSDTTDNGVTACLTDHRLIHLYATGDLHLPAEKSQDEIDKMEPEERVLYEDEQMRFKRIVKLGQVIRDAAAMKGMKRDEFKKKHPVGSIGRNKPGKIQEEG